MWRSSGHVSMVAGSKPGRPARQNPSRDCCICMSDPGGKAWSENWWAKPATVRATPAQYRACSGGCLRETDAGLRVPSAWRWLLLPKSLGGMWRLLSVKLMCIPGCAQKGSYQGSSKL